MDWVYILLVVGIAALGGYPLLRTRLRKGKWWT